jgi:hypothetical protein
MKSIDLSRLSNGGKIPLYGINRPALNYFINRAAGLCLLCGDKPAPGDTYCPKCQAENDKLLGELNK